MGHTVLPAKAELERAPQHTQLDKAPFDLHTRIDSTPRV